jgi:acyl dehydratase
MPQKVAISELAGFAGKELGHSEWVQIEQERVNQFADATGDHQFIHVDPERATPLFGGTIAHGFLTLSMSVTLLGPFLIEPEGHGTWINYGLNKVRFVAPVRTGKRIRMAVKVAEVTEKRPGSYLFTYDVAMEIEGEAKPAYIAQLLLMSVAG